MINAVVLYPDVSLPTVTRVTQNNLFTERRLYNKKKLSIYQTDLYGAALEFRLPNQTSR